MSDESETAQRRARELQIQSQRRRYELARAYELEGRASTIEKAPELNGAYRAEAATTAYIREHVPEANQTKVREIAQEAIAERIRRGRAPDAYTRREAERRREEERERAEREPQRDADRRRERELSSEL